MHINDVGAATWEEVNLGARGANYGWPGSEGPDNVSGNVTGPVYAYGHNPASPTGSGPGGFLTGIAVTGGVFYPDSGTFPAVYRGQYFFCDFGSGWLARMDLANNNAVYSFGHVESNPLGMLVGTDGALYVLAQQSITRIAPP
jgi:glucose/arabinose dehydrogenase